MSPTSTVNDAPDGLRIHRDLHVLLAHCSERLEECGDRLTLAGASGADHHEAVSHETCLVQLQALENPCNHAIAPLGTVKMLQCRKLYKTTSESLCFFPGCFTAGGSFGPIAVQSR